MAAVVTHAHVSAIADDGSDVGSNAWNANHTVTGLAASATTDTSDAGNISSGTLAAAQGGAGAVSGILKADGAGVVSAATAGTDYALVGAVTVGDLTMNTARLLGRTTGSSGAVEELTVGAGLTFSAGALGGAVDHLVQMVFTETGAQANGTTNIPFDDTIPQKTEGDQYMTLTITPTNTASILIISMTAILSVNLANRPVAQALFQDTTAGALAAVCPMENSSLAATVYTWRHIMTAGTTSATTFKLRAGTSLAGQVTTFNGSNAARLHGGVLASSMMIEEYL